VKPYPETKNSGIDWISDIPIHWNVHRTDHHFDHIKERNTKDDERVVLSLSYGKVVRRNIETNFGLLPESFDTYQVLNPGDIVLRLTDLQNDKRSLRVGLSRDRGIITSAYVGLRAKSSKEHSPYFYHLFHTYDIIKVFYTLGGGVRQSMRFEDVRRIPLLIPPLPEQQKIVSFLDSKTSLIDKIIDNKTQRIELLKEMRSSLISEVVTKGLNPDVLMKDSEVEWIGEIPSHWRSLQLIRCIRFTKGGSWGDEPQENEFDRVCLRVADFDYVRLRIRKDKLTVRNQQFDRTDERVLLKNDLLIEKSGGGETTSVGRCVLFRGELEEPTYSNFISLLRPNEMVDPEWLVLLLSSIYSSRWNTRSIKQTTGIQNLDLDHYTRNTIPLPPLPEQENIVLFLDEKTSLIDQEIGREKNSIEYLREFRQSLIHEVVTGKKDVRGEMTS
jgi:type I restriction enzyme S subunit